ncbi:MAG: TonB-dependent receptor plug domain-containing protein [Methyloligellaceae bacterium]
MHNTKVKQLSGIVPGILAAGLAITTSIHSAQAEVNQLPGIVVEASSLDGEGTEASRVGSSVTVITGEELERQKISHVADALRGIPGVHVSQTGSRAGLTNIRLRGSESNHTLILIDGIEANANTDGAFDFSDLTTDNIERIEVIRGPQSGIYGSKALGGVISITTKKGKGPLKGRISGEAGAFDTVKGSMNVSGGTDKIYASLTASKFSTNGFDVSPGGTGETEEARRSSLMFRGGFSPYENFKLDFTFRNVDKEGGIDGVDFSGNPIDNNDTINTRLMMFGAKGTLSTFDNKWVHTFQATRNSTNRGGAGGEGAFAYTYFHKGVDDKLSYISSLKLPTSGKYLNSHSLTGLAEYKTEEFTTSSASGVEFERTHNSFAAEYKAELFNQLSLATSVRQDNSVEEQNNTENNFTTYKVSGSWRVPNSGLRVHSNVGTGVVFPTMFEQYGSFPPFFEPNENIKPEESFGWDLGVEWTAPKGSFTIDVTYFDQDLKNEIVGVLVDPVNFISSVENAEGKGNRRGVEIAVKTRLSKQLYLTSSYTYLDAKQNGGEQAVRRPKHSVKTNFNYRFDEGRGNLNLNVNYNGDMADIGGVTLDDYVLVNLAGSYKVKPNVELYARVENLLDEDYQEVFGYETAGISAYAGIKIKLGTNE